jgi:hypothetical protein
LSAISLLNARKAVLDEEIKPKRSIYSSGWVFILFAVPAASAAYMSLQFVLKLFPAVPGCDGWSWSRLLTDFSHQGGTPSVYCLGDLTNGTPWIYPPWQTYFYSACVVGCGYLTYRLMDDGGRQGTPDPWHGPFGFVFYARATGGN